MFYLQTSLCGVGYSQLKTISKIKICKACKGEFMPFNSMQKTCLNPQCSLAYVREKEEKAFNTETRRKKKELKRNDRSYWIKKAQESFNKFIRERDKYKPCISCGRSSGCKVNAGHYRSVGAMPALRFEELNVHLQCEHCNCFQSGNAIDYRLGLIKKIGQYAVDWLEGPHEPKKHTIAQLQELKKTYDEKYKELYNERD